MIFVSLVIGIVAFLWLILSFMELPKDNPHKFDSAKYWNSKETKWRGEK